MEHKVNNFHITKEDENNFLQFTDGHTEKIVCYSFLDRKQESIICEVENRDIYQLIVEEKICRNSFKIQMKHWERFDKDRQRYIYVDDVELAVIYNSYIEEE